MMTAVAVEHEEDVNICPYEVAVTMDATDPPELLRGSTPDGVWMRVRYGAHRAEVTVRGPHRLVRDFLIDNWGEDAVDGG